MTKKPRVTNQLFLVIFPPATGKLLESYWKDTAAYVRQSIGFISRR